MKTIQELTEWIEGAAEEFADPSEPIAQIFCKWVEPLEIYRGDELVAGTLNGTSYLRLGPGAMLPVQIQTGRQGTIDQEGMPTYGAQPIAPGLWSLTPSLYIPGFVHAFVTLYNVPIKTPWETRVIPVEKFDARGLHLAVLR